MMKKRIFSLFMVAIMVCALAGGCGNKKEADKEEKKTEASDDQTKKKEEDEHEEAAEPVEIVDEETVKTGADTLSEEDIAELKYFIKEAVMREYLEPNGIVPNEYVWPATEDEWQPFFALTDKCGISLASGSKYEIEDAGSDVYSAVMAGILNWLDTQGNYDSFYFGNTIAVLRPYHIVIPEIDLTEAE